MIGPSIQSRDGWMRREQILPLPGQVDKYTRVLFLGTTGAGKTTLVRQFLGTHPSQERFPSTSTGKTTTAAFELILAPDLFRAIVTFLPREHIERFIKECLLAAAFAIYERKQPQEVKRKFLIHDEQRFRLHYILGDIKDGQPEKRPHEQNSQLYLQMLIDLVEQYREAICQAVQPAMELSEGEQTQLRQEAVEHILQAQPAFQKLADDLLQTIHTRFLSLTQGQVLSGDDGWPQSWAWDTPDRALFIKTINDFSSNYAKRFGRLLTPLVQGIRVSGPFQPAWRSEAPARLVLIDGEGLGHTPETMTSLPTSITELFEQVDVILLVENVTLPFQGASEAVLKTVVASGHAAKLLIGCTHFEGVHGDDFSDRQAREDHVRSSLDNILREIGQKVSQQDRYLLQQSLEERIFFLAHLDEPFLLEAPTEDEDEEHAATRAALRSMLAAIEATHLPSLPPDTVRPTYTEPAFVQILQQAFAAFRHHWKGRLGIEQIPKVDKEHWKRVEALTRRVALWQVDEYDTLRPVADLIKEVSEQTHSFLLTRPLYWEPSSATEEHRQALIDAIARDFHAQLHTLIRQYLVTAHHPEWCTAFDYRGPGSARRRAQEIDGIYCAVAPLPTELIQDAQSDSSALFVLSADEIHLNVRANVPFTRHLVDLLRTILRAYGGTLRRSASKERWLP